jgi:ribosomal protein L37AE/L43A
MVIYECPFCGYKRNFKQPTNEKTQCSECKHTHKSAIKMHQMFKKMGVESKNQKYVNMKVK